MPLLLFFRKEQTPKSRLYPQSIKKICCNVISIDSFRVSTDVQVERDDCICERTQLLKRVTLLLVVFKIRRRNACLFSSRPLPPDPRYAFRMIERKGPQQHRIHDGKNSGVRTYAESKHEDDN